MFGAQIHFSRKCPERPFENIMSVVCKYPWYQPNLVTALQRDHIYECLKLAIGKQIARIYAHQKKSTSYII